MQSFDMNRLRQTVILGLIGTLIITLVTLMIFTVPEENRDFFNIVIGFFLAKGADAVGFLLNSTERSNQKDEAIAKASAATSAALAVALPGATSTPEGGTTIHVDPPATVDIKEKPDAPEANAGRPVEEPAGVSSPSGIQPGSGRPAE